jgi:N utilization substance protein A
MTKAGHSPAFFILGNDLFMNSELIAMLDYLERERGINRDVLVEAISSALLAASKKNFTSGTRELRIEINPKSGAIRAMAKLIAAERIQNPHDEILLSKARALQPEIQAGEEIEVEVTPRDFGRIAAQAARQAINQRIRQIEKDMIYEEFKDRAGEIVSGTVRRFEKSDVIIDLGKFEGTMTSRERVVTEEYSIGDRLRAYVVAVDNAARGPEIILSRSHPNFVRRLFEIEVSEIADRTVELKAIAREAGYRTKVAVHSADPKVDPVGACVGMRGARVKNIVRELNNEKVDIIRWDPDPLKFAAAALKPANIRNISLDHDKHTVRVLVGKDDLSLAIGKRGQNARLTSKLTGWEVDIQEDKTAEQQLESQKAQAAHSMADVLGVTEEEAQTLTSSGMNSIDAVLTAEASDISEVLGCDIERGQKILEAAKAAGQPTEPAAS